MAAAKSKPTLNSHFTPASFLYFLLLATSSHLLQIQAFNVTGFLSRYPDLSDFTSLLTSTGIYADLNRRSSLTILAVPNSYLRSSIFPSTSPSILADVIRYHILLQYFSLSDLRRTPVAGTLITTLLQTTGKVPNNSGSLNVTLNDADGVISFHPPYNNSVSANVTSLLKKVPFNLSIFTVDSLLIPYGFDLTASETRPPPAAVNITGALIGGHDFNVAVAMLVASGVVEEFEKDEVGAGITLFVPTDEAFSNLPPTVQFPGLSAEMKALVLKFHVLHSYYPLGSLELIVNPVQPTLATEDNSAGSFTLNIRRVNGSVAINTGIVQAVITQTVFDQNPIAIFGVSRVLLPREIFGKEPANVSYRGTQKSDPPSEAMPVSVDRDSSHLSGFKAGKTSGGGRMGDLVRERNWGLCLFLFLFGLW